LTAIAVIQEGAFTLDAQSPSELQHGAHAILDGPQILP
jgi:hypothetical protein